MAILGGRVTRIEAKRMEDNNVEGINLNINVTNVVQDKKLLTVKYTSIIEYAPKVAQMTVDGEVLIEEETEKKAKEVVDEYKKNKQLPDALTEEIVTTVNYSSTATGTLLAFGMGLNAPINVPRAKIVKQPAGNQQAG